MKPFKSPVGSGIVLILLFSFLETHGFKDDICNVNDDFSTILNPDRILNNERFPEIIKGNTRSETRSFPEDRRLFERSIDHSSRVTGNDRRSSSPQSRNLQERSTFEARQDRRNVPDRVTAERKLVDRDVTQRVTSRLAERTVRDRMVNDRFDSRNIIEHREARIANRRGSRFAAEIRSNRRIGENSIDRSRLVRTPITEGASRVPQNRIQPGSFEPSRRVISNTRRDSPLFRERRSIEENQRNVRVNAERDFADRRAETRRQRSAAKTTRNNSRRDLRISGERNSDSRREVSDNTISFARRDFRIINREREVRTDTRRDRRISDGRTNRNNEQRRVLNTDEQIQVERRDGQISSRRIADRKSAARSAKITPTESASRRVTTEDARRAVRTVRGPAERRQDVRISSDRNFAERQSNDETRYANTKSRDNIRQHRIDEDHTRFSRNLNSDRRLTGRSSERTDRFLEHAARSSERGDRSSERADRTVTRFLERRETLDEVRSNAVRREQLNRRITTRSADRVADDRRIDRRLAQNSDRRNLRNLQLSNVVRRETIRRDLQFTEHRERSRDNSRRSEETIQRVTDENNNEINFGGRDASIYRIEKFDRDYRDFTASGKSTEGNKMLFDIAKTFVIALIIVQILTKTSDPKKFGLRRITDYMNTIKMKVL